MFIKWNCFNQYYKFPDIFDLLAWLCVGVCELMLCVVCARVCPRFLFLVCVAFQNRVRNYDGTNTTEKSKYNCLYFNPKFQWIVSGPIPSGRDISDALTVSGAFDCQERVFRFAHIPECAADSNSFILPVPRSACQRQRQCLLHRDSSARASSGTRATS